MFYVIVFIKGVKMIRYDLNFFGSSLVAKARLFYWQKVVLNEGLVSDDGNFCELSENYMFIGDNEILVNFQELEIIIGKTECYFFQPMPSHDFFGASE